jgi:eukaryotic-like serine/threonine-protein kinase
MLREGELLGGRYRLVRRLGAGGMGEVWEALHEGLGRHVALKAILPSLTSDPVLLARFQREAQAAASLGHPNIVQVTDFAAPQGEPAFLVMELLSGMSLSRAIEQQGPMPESRVAFIAAQVLTALDVAHRANLVHRDIKPDNIFLTSVAGVEVVKVLDFGIAKLYGESEAAKLTQTGVVMGTPQYMSPEQARGKAVDARTDLYAVGTAMFQALTGRLPFGAGSINALLFAIADDPPPPVSALRADADPRFCAVIERALAKDPAHRYGSALEMRDALEPWLTTAKPISIVPRASTLANAPTVGVTPAMPTTMALAPTPPKKGRGGVIAAVVVVAALLIGGGAFVVHSMNSDDPTKVAAGDKTPKAKKPVKDDPTPDHEEDPVPPPSAEPSVKPKAPVAPKPTTSASTEPSTPPTTTASTPAPKKPTAGRTATLSSITTHFIYSAAAVRKVATAKSSEVNNCYFLNEYDPVPHESMSWQIVVGPDGNIVTVGPPGGGPRSNGLDLCMTKIMRSFVFGPTDNGKSGAIVLGYSAPLPP